MRRWRRLLKALILLFSLLLLIGCGDQEAEMAATRVVPTATSVLSPTPDPTVTGRDRDFVVIAADVPIPNFTDFDQFGNVIGFDSDLMARLSALAGFEYEFVVTPFEGILDTIATQSNRDFDAVMSALVIPEQPPDGVVYTEPYLQVGQVVMVLADEEALQSYRDIRQGMAIGIRENSRGEQAAREVLDLDASDLIGYDSEGQALQALVDGVADAVIVDSFTAEHFARAFPEQLKIVGGEGESAWIDSKGFGIAVAATNTALLERLNQAIVEAKHDLTIERLTVAWLIPKESINAGESRVPTPASDLIIGIAGQLNSMDPASDPDLISWELKNNTMSGLFVWNSSSELVPMLAAEQPAITEDKLEYTIQLRQGLRFPDGSELTAEDVKWSVNRAARLGSFLINDFLKDSNEDNFADEDAVQIVDQFTVKFILQEPTAYFLSLLATPPYFPVSSECFKEAWDLTSICGGLGPYNLVSWEPDRVRLKANPEWPGQPAPAFENIHVRFYEEPANMARSLIDFQSIDVAWTGLPFSDQMMLRSTDLNGDGSVDFKSWEGAAIFKSYLMFEHSTPPWDSQNVRQAAALAIDRAELAQTVFEGSRIPLFSPIPDAVPGHVAVFPQPNLEAARELLLAEGYSSNNPLEITIWFTNDGHYTPLEAAYANVIKTQLEATEVFQVTLAGEAWEVFRPQISQCNYPAYLLGWPTPGQPANYLDPTSWTDFFVENTSSGFCSNYESEEMTALVEAAEQELDPAARLAQYEQIQRLWAEEIPTLPLTQEPRQAISLNKVDNLRIDALGLLHYEVLTKGGG